MVVDVREAGAVGDGETNNTPVFRTALESIRDAGGGELVVPPGVYRTGSIELYDNTTLRVQNGATLLGSPELSDYVAYSQGHNKDRTAYHMINAVGRSHVTITGGGVIDGSGPRFWKPQSEPGAFFSCDPERRPSPMVEITRCSDVRIIDITLQNSPGWTCHVHDCDRTFIRGVRIENNPLGPNTDGFDLSGVRDLVMSDCVVETGDDAIVLKTPPDSRSIRSVTVTNCIVRTHCVGLKLGAGESCFDVENVIFSNCVVHGSSRMVGVYVFEKGVYSNIRFQNITGDTRVGLIQNRPIHVEARARRRYTDQPGAIRDLVVDGFSAETDGRVLITATPECPVRGVSLRNISLRYPMIYDNAITADVAKSRQFSQKHPEARRARAVLVVEGVEDLSVDDLRVAWPADGDPPPEWRFEQRLQNGGPELFPEPEPDPALPFAVAWFKRCSGRVSRIATQANGDATPALVADEHSAAAIDFGSVSHDAIYVKETHQ